MKNRKNRFIISAALLLIYLISLFSTVSVSAAGLTISDTSCKIDAKDGKKLTVEGKTSTANADVSIVVYKQGETPMGAHTKYVGSISSDAEGKFSKIITIYDAETTKQLYNIDIAFDNPDAAQVVETVQFANEKQIEYSIGRLKASPNVYTYITNADTISAVQNTTLFKNIGVWTDDLTNAAATIANASKADISRENIAEVLNGSIVAAAINDTGKTTEQKVSMLKAYDETAYPIAVSGKAFGVQSDKNWIVENIQLNNSGGFAKYDDLVKEAKKSLLLSLIGTTDSVNLKTMLLDNTTLLNDDLNELDDLGETDSDTVLEQIKLTHATSKYQTTAALVGDIKKAIGDLPDDTVVKDPVINQNNNNNGGGGGGGGVLGYTKPQDDTKPNTQISANNGHPFKDLANYKWAEEAVTSLYKAGIVSGVSADLYEPGRSIAREEFVKLVCVAFGFGESTSYASFKDVPKDAWYSKYVARAVELGIITGVTETTFGAGRSISREDMSVIIVRSLKAKGIDVKISDQTFADDHEIADYAKEAVKALAGMGIVNGTGNNKFSPKAYTNRAETAVIIDRCLKNLINK